MIKLPLDMTDGERCDEIVRLRKLVEELRGDISHAVSEAQKYQPEYPWRDNTASEAVWACGQAYLGVKAANEDLHTEIKRLKELCIRIGNQLGWYASRYACDEATCGKCIVCELDNIRRGPNYCI